MARRKRTGLKTRHYMGRRRQRCRAEVRRDDTLRCQPWPPRGARSVVAGAVANGAFGKPEHARLIGLFGGEGAAFFTACGDAAGVIFVFFAVDPLEQDV